MNHLPHQSNPVRRSSCELPTREPNPARTHASQNRNNVAAAGYEECYSLPGAAQKMCLLAY